MKKFLPLGFTLLFASALLAAQPKAPARSDLENRVAELEEGLAAQRKATESAEERLTQIQRYLEKQAAGAKALSAALDKAELEGFAKGINFQSRITLLEGWREALEAAQKGLPKAQTTTARGEAPKLRSPRKKER